MLIPNEKSVLKNGLRVMQLPSTAGEVAAIGFAVNSGTYFETPEESGVAHMVEHLISRSRVKNKSLREKIHQSGALFDASTSLSQTYFHLYCFHDDLISLVKLLTDGIFKLEFNKKDLDAARESVIAEMSYALELTDYEILRKIMWKDERLSKQVMGSKESINTLTEKDIKRFYDSFYGSDNTSLIVISDQIPGGFEEILEKIPVIKTKNDIKVSTAIRKPDYRIFQNGSLNTTLTIGFPTLGYKDLGEDRHVFNLGATLLKSIFNSQLGSSGLVYNIDWTWNVFPESGDFVIVIEDLPEEHLMPVAEKYVDIIGSWFKTKPLVEEFISVKKHRLLRLKLGESITEALALFTKNFASSKGAHNYEEAYKVYEEAGLDDTYKALEKVLLTKTPFTVINLGINSGKYLGKLNQLFQDFYKKENGK